MGIKKQLAGTVLAAGIGIAAISGGTFALFTDSATNNGNTIAAGTVSISDETGSGNVFVNVTDLAPGDSEVGKIKVKNDGSLDEWVKIESAVGTGDLFTAQGTTPPASVTAEATEKLLAPGEEYTFNVTYSLPEASDNEYQGDSGTVVVKVQSVQAKNNTKEDNSGPKSWN